MWIHYEEKNQNTFFLSQRFFCLAVVGSWLVGWGVFWGVVVVFSLDLVLLVLIFNLGPPVALCQVLELNLPRTAGFSQKWGFSVCFLSWVLAVSGF